MVFSFGTMTFVMQPESLLIHPFAVDRQCNPLLLPYAAVGLLSIFPVPAGGKA